MSFQISKNISYVNEKIISDTAILNQVGIVTYCALQYKYPYWFMNFRECTENVYSEEGRLPSWVNLYISENPQTTKEDLVMLLIDKNPKYYEHKYLIDSSIKPTFPLLEKEDNTYFWIFLNIFMLVLIFIAIIVIFKS
jgi:hypothetical protein